MTTPAARRTLLTAALGFRAIEWRYRPDPAGALEKYLPWRGLGDVIVGMHAQGFDVELRQLGDHCGARNSTRRGWRIQSCTDPPGSGRRGGRSRELRGRPSTICGWRRSPALPIR